MELELIEEAFESLISEGFVGITAANKFMKAIIWPEEPVHLLLDLSNINEFLKQLEGN